MSDWRYLPDPKDWPHFVRIYDGIGWELALLTFMFEQMPGDDRAVGRQQEREVESIYARVVTRVVRRPASCSAVNRLPIWLCFPDRPVSKRNKQSLRDVTINNGAHVHAVAMTPPRNRLGSDFVTFVEDNPRLFTDHLRCCRVHAEHILYDPSSVLRYAAKSVLREDDPGAYFILPRSRSEVRDTPAPVGRNSSIFGV